MSNFVPIIQFGFDGSNKSQMELSMTYVEASFGAKHLQGLVPKRRAELCKLLRMYADQIESGWLRKQQVLVYNKE